MKKKYKKVFVAGTFDNFHVGHQYLLWNAKKEAKNLVIIVARDETVLKIKGSKPRNSEKNRLNRLLAENMPKTRIRMGREDGDFPKTLAEESPCAIFLGYDQHFDEKKFSGDFFKNIDVIRMEPYLPHIFKSSHFQYLT